MNQQDSAQHSQGDAASEPRPLATAPHEQNAPAPFSQELINTDTPQQPPAAAQPPPIYIYRPLPAPRQPRRRWPWALLAVLIVALLLALAAPFIPALYTTVSEARNFSVSGVPRLTILLPSGNVHIESGQAGQISMLASKHVFLGNSTLLQVHYIQEGSAVSVTTTASSFTPLQDNRVDFAVFVPDSANLSITAENGSIQANGIIGTIELQTSSGSIQADNLAGALRLKTESGSITASNLKGQMTLAASSGSITASAISATDNSSFQTDSGSIDVAGALDPNGTYLFRVASGTVDLTLSPSASFHVDARTESGAIASDFPSVVVQRGSTGATAHGDVGTPPGAQIIIQAQSGSITLHQG
jgi:hypothetical protein